MSRKFVPTMAFYGLALAIGLYISSGQPIQIRLTEVSLAVMLTVFSRTTFPSKSDDATAHSTASADLQLSIQSPAILLNLLDHMDRNLLSAALTLDDRHQAPLRSNDPTSDIDLVA